MTNDNYLEVSVYGHEDPTTRLDVLPNATSPKFLEEIGGAGSGQISISRLDPKFLQSMPLLAYRNIVKLSCGGEVFSAFTVGNRADTFIDSNEDASKIETVSGDGLKSWLSAATVYPEGGLKQTSPDNRVFSWASVRTSWYNAADWAVPTRIEQYHMLPDKTGNLIYNFNPAEWPDAPTAWWVWSQPPTYETVGGKRLAVMPEGNAYFRYEFNVAEADAGDYSLFAAADDSYVAFVDSALAIDATQPLGSTQYHKTVRYDFTLEAGFHVIAFRVTNRKRRGSRYRNPAALLAALFKAGDADSGVAASIVTTTGQTNGWRVNGYPAQEPGWTVGEIWTVLLAEAKARGIRFPNWLKPSFTEDKDSAGVAWADRLPFSFSVGTTYLEVLQQMEELAVEAWIDPDTYAFNIAQKRGTDRSEVTATSDAVTFREGFNLVKAGTQGEADLTNALLMKTDDGWIVTQPDDSTSQSMYGRLESSISTSVNSSLSRKLSAKVFEQKAIPETGSSYTILPQPGSIPNQDFFVGDWVKAPDADGVMQRRRVMSLSVTEDNAGNPSWAVEFDTIFQTKEEEYDRMTKLVTGSGLGSGFVSANGGGTGGTSPVSGEGSTDTPGAPNFPSNLSATSTGFFTKTGVALSNVSFTWDPVETDVDGVPIRGISRYEIMGRTSTAGAYQSLGVVTGANTAMDVNNLASDQDWTFVIRAYVDSARVSDLSDPPLLHHTAAPAVLMPAPTDPTLATNLGTVTAFWDGSLSTGVPPVQFGYVFAEYRIGSGAWTSVGSTPIKGGIVITGLPIGSAVDVRLKAKDSLGRDSDPSNVVSIVVEGVDTSDLGQQFEDDFQAIKDQAADAQTKAGEAATAAEAAQKAAEDAAEASGGIIYQEDTPDASMAGRLWVKPSTKKSYLYDDNTQQWEEITDPAIAQAAQDALAAKTQAKEAFDKAVAAAGQAGEALTSADGKSRIWYLDNAPAGTDHKVNDTWFDTNDSNKMYTWDGDSWEPKQFGENAIQDLAITNAKISNLDAAKITTGFLDAGRIQSATITSRMLAVGDFKDYLDGSNFEGATSTIPWTNIPDTNAVLDTTIKHNGSKSVRLLTTGPYVAPPITTVTNTYTNLANNPEAQVNTTNWFNLNNAGYKFERIALAASDQYLGAASAVRLYPGTGAAGGLRLRDRVPVTAGQTLSMSMGLRTNENGRNLQVLISFTTSDATTEVPSKTRYSIAAKKMTANQWKSFSLEKFVVPDGAAFMMIDAFSSNQWSSNSPYILGTAVMVNQGATVNEYFTGNTPASTESDENATYTNTYAWTGTAGNSTSVWTEKVDTIGDAPTQATREYSSNYDVPVQVGQRFVLSGWFYTASQYNGDDRGAYLEIRDPASGKMLGQTTLGLSSLSQAGVWTQISASAVIPVGTSAIRAYLRVNHTRGLLYADDISLKNGAGVLIEEGAITAPMLRADSVTANAIQAGAVQTEQLDAYAITSKHTITGALIRTAEDGARTEMTAQGIRVVDDNENDLVRLGYGVSNGMAIRDPNAAKLIPLANIAFGAAYWSSGSNFTVGSTATESVWSGYTTEVLGDWTAPSGRVIWLWFALSAESNQQNFKIEGQAYMVDSTDTSVGARVVLTNAVPIYWTSGFFMGVKSVVQGRSYSVRNSYRSWRNFSGVGTPTIVTRTTILMPV